MSLAITLDDVSVDYPRHRALDHVTASVPAGSFTAVLGPNGCGKSTLLRAVTQLVRPSEGEVRVADRPVRSYPRRELARTLGLLPQQTPVPPGLTVHELVRRGRAPYQRWLGSASAGDEGHVTDALTRTSMLALADAPLTELSGGQRQRAWFAMVLAQDTPVVLLDEPTTYLDLAHQFALLDLCAELHDQGRTIVAVLHDLPQAAAYADHVLLLHDGRLVGEGAPREVLTSATVSTVYGIECVVDLDAPVPVVSPRRRDDRLRASSRSGAPTPASVARSG